MDEYIERESAIQAVEKTLWQYQQSVIELRKVPSADVAPVRHGRWVKMDTTGLLAVESVWNCSSCGYPVGVSVAGSKFCPNCGCKMDLNDLED